MSTLLEKATAIKTQKDTYLLPENLKSGVTCLGVTGTYDGGGGGSGRYKLVFISPQPFADGSKMIVTSTDNTVGTLPTLRTFDGELKGYQKVVMHQHSNNSYAYSEGNYITSNTAVTEDSVFMADCRLGYRYSYSIPNDMQDKVAFLVDNEQVYTYTSPLVLSGGTMTAPEIVMKNNAYRHIGWIGAKTGWNVQYTKDILAITSVNVQSSAYFIYPKIVPNDTSVFTFSLVGNDEVSFEGHIEVLIGNVGESTSYPDGEFADDYGVICEKTGDTDLIGGYSKITVNICDITSEDTIELYDLLGLYIEPDFPETPLTWAKFENVLDSSDYFEIDAGYPSVNVSDVTNGATYKLAEAG